MSSAIPVRWGILGAGNMASVMAAVVSSVPGATVRAVGSRDVKRAAAVCRSVADAKPYGSYEDLLDDDAVDAVYVALANRDHVTWASRALAAGRAVLCEKPLGLSASEVDRLSVAARLSGKLLCEALWYLWQPRYALASRLLCEGALGSVQRIRARLRVPPVAVNNYRWDPELGGGALADIGCYVVSAALWAMSDALPEQVRATWRLASTGVDASARISLSWPTADASLECGMDSGAVPSQSLTVTCDRGTLDLREVPFVDDLSSLADRRLRVMTANGPEDLVFANVNAYVRMVEDVGMAIRREAAFVVPLAHSRSVAAVLDAARAAARSGRPCPVDRSGGTCSDDAEVTTSHPLAGTVMGELARPGSDFTSA